MKYKVKYAGEKILSRDWHFFHISMKRRENLSLYISKLATRAFGIVKTFSTFSNT